MIWDEIAETVCRNTLSLMDILRNAKDARIGTPIDRWTDEDLSEQLDTVHDDNQRRAVVAALMAIKQGAAPNRLKSITDCLRKNWQSLTADDALFPSKKVKEKLPQFGSCVQAIVGRQVGHFNLPRPVTARFGVAGKRESARCQNQGASNHSQPPC
jgi:hypothetical protein